MVNSLKNKKRVVAIVQARTGSTRLPNKVLLDLAGKKFLWHVLQRIKTAKNIDELVLAMPDTQANDILEKFAEENGFKYFRGSEKNLLERHYLAAKEFGAEVVVRIPSDNAATDPGVINLVIERHLDSDADYTSNVLEETFPVGLHVEVFNLGALEKAFNNATEEYEREHATPYIYRHPELFKLQSVAAEGKLKRPEIRLTTDIERDFELIKEIYKNLYKPGKIFYIEEVIDFLDKNPHLIKINTQK